jgi:pyridinium-3,5-bisthiocarboxylic acid mononucleotide nickel chelatase
MSDKTLYLECYSGISGDMTVAALLDLGADQQVLLDGLKSLKVEGYRVVIGRRDKNSISACDFDVILDEAVQKQEGSGHSHAHAHTISNPKISRGRTISSSRTPIKYGHHDHRNLSIINDIIDSSTITDNAKRIAKRIFFIVAAAEAKAHGKPIEEVHFHEVGAIDSIVDIVATAICLDDLNIKEVVVSELYEGTGFVKCQHGLLPIPVPAVINIATEHQLPLHITDVKGELVTPTGAAIVAAIRTKPTLPKEMRIQKIGLGAGKRSYQGASGLLRAMLIEEVTTRNSDTLTDKVWVLEANIDDCPGEALAYTLELLLKQGAKDAYYTPIFMKKNRPAYLLGVICSEDQLERMEEIIFTNTTTIGIRRSEMLRSMLSREQRTVNTPHGVAAVKVCTYKDRIFYYPEYESIKKLCEASGIDYLTMYHMVQTKASQGR